MAKSVWQVAIFIFMLLLLTACNDAKEQVDTPAETATAINADGDGRVQPANTPTETAVFPPTPTPITYPPLTIPKELIYCMVSEPDNLFIHDESSGDEASMWHAIYENLYTTLDYGYQPQGLEKLPNLDDGDAVVNRVTVKEGDTVVDAAGNITELTSGTVLSDANGAEFAFTGTPVMLPQMVVTFTLKPMVWSDGTAVSASDSVYSYELDKAYDDEHRIQHTASYSAIDDLTVQWIGLPGWLDSTYFLNVWTPLPQHQLATKEGDDPAGWFRANDPILSSGPFFIEDWIAGDNISLKANPYYYRQSEQLPNLEKVVVKFIPDTNSAIAQLLVGSCDMISQTIVSMDDFPFFQEATTLELITAYYQPNLIFEHIDFGINSYGEYGDGNGRPDWFEDVRVRQAVAHCTDRQRMIDEIYYGQSHVMHTYIPPSHPLHPTDLPQYAYDPALANALLDEAGYLDSDGDGIREDPVTGTPFTVTLETVKYPEMRVTITQIFQKTMHDCGIDVTLSYLPNKDFFADGPDGPLFGRQYDLAEFAWLMAAEPPCSLWHSKNITGPEEMGWGGWDNSNNTGWHNERFDAACTQTEQTFFNSPTHVASHQEAMTLFAKELPILPLFPRVNGVAILPFVRNVKLDPTQRSELWNIFELDMERPFANSTLTNFEPARFCTDVSEIPTNECQALVTLISRINHVENRRWFYYYNWLNSPTPCSWAHINCANNHVTALDLSSFGIEYLPSEIGNFAYLNHLDLSYNNLSSLPAEIGYLTKLTNLDLERNNLTNLPSEIGNLTSLSHLNLASNDLSSLPPSLGYLTNLHHLDLTSNSLDNLPAEMGALKALVELDLSGNDLSSLPAEFWEFSKLENLSLGGNNFCIIPSEIGNLTNLTSLNLAGVELCELPIEISNLTNLTELRLSSNQLTGLPSEIGSLINLTELHLSYNELTSLPSEIGHLTNLTSLNLRDNRLTNLSPEIGNLTNLTKLWLSSNYLNSLPPEIGNLTSLADLELNNNRLTHLPSEFGSLIHLNMLSLSSNRLSHLPDEFGDLLELDTLYLRNNHFDTFPSEIVNIINLQRLYLDSNNLQNVPSTIGEMRNLESLSLKENQIRTLPLEIGNLRYLSSLYLDENPIDALPAELCAALPNGLWLKPYTLCSDAENGG